MADDSADLTQLEQQYGLPAGLLTAQMQAESANNPQAVSPAGAQGLMQFMPSTAQQYGIDPTNPVQAVQGAARYMGDLLKANGGDINKALAAYNWGQGNLNKNGLDNAPAETKAYVQKITQQLASNMPDTAVGTDAQDSLSPPDGFVLDSSAKGTPLPPDGFVQDSSNASATNPKPASQGATILDQGLQGVTFGLGNRASAGLAALALSAMNDKGVGKNYKDSRNSESNRLANEVQQRPALSLLSNLAGGLATGGLGTDTAAGTALANSLRSGNLTARAAKGALAGAATGTAYGAGSAGYGQTGKGAEQGAVTGALTGGAIPVASSALRGIGNAIVPQVSDSVRTAANLAQQYGIPLGLDQISDSKPRQYLASATAALPFSGGGKLPAAQRATFNSAVAKAVGAKDLTNEGFANAMEDVGKKFDSLTAGRTISVPDGIRERVQQIVSDANDSLSPDRASIVSNSAKKFMDSIADKSSQVFGADDGPVTVRNGLGTIDGEKLGSIRSSLTRTLKNAGDASSYIGDLLNTVMDTATEGSPNAQKALNEARSQYKGLMTIAPLVAKDGTGDISPSLLKGQVINSYGVRNVAKGNAGALGDLAKVADLMKAKAPSSGTAERLAAYGELAGIPGFILAGEPGAAATLVGTTLGARVLQSYNRSQPLVRAALSRGASSGPSSLGLLGTVGANATINKPKFTKIGGN